MAKKFKDKLVEAVYNEVKASGMEKEFMHDFTCIPVVMHGCESWTVKKVER